MPSAARLVALNHLDASKITPSGPGGRIQRYDVVAYMEQQKSAKKAPKTTAQKVVPRASQRGDFVD